MPAPNQFITDLVNYINAYLQDKNDEILQNYRVIISIEKPVSVRLIKKVFKKKGPTLTQQERENIKQAKTVLKQNVDAMYLYSLLSKIHITLNSLNVNDLPAESKQLFVEQMTKLEKDLQPKLELEHKSEIIDIPPIP